MPHTRAARLKAIKEASDLRDVLQMHSLNTNLRWNDYLHWDVPGLTYQPDALAWFPTEDMDSTQPDFASKVQSPANNATNVPLDQNYEPTSNPEFQGLRTWYSSAPGDLSTVSPVEVSRPRLLTSVHTSYNSTSLSEPAQQTNETYGTEPWSHKGGHQRSFVDESTPREYISDAQPAQPDKGAGEQSSPSSEEEQERISTAKTDAHKKRKIAHSVIEKNYRGRIKDGMAELRHCVPSKENGRRSLDSRSRPATGDAMLNQSSGKVAILSDAVEYVKSLERENEVLHGQLDVMQRRNNALQKIALSKVNTVVSVEELGDEEQEEGVAQWYDEQADWRNKRPGRHGKGEDRSMAVAHAPSLARRRLGSVSRTLAGVKISGE